jgi:uncharacterized protein involved in tellurium resistance
VGEQSLFAELGQPAATIFHTYFEDFDYYTAGDWTVTETDAGATQALTDGDGGLLLITNTAADNDLVSLQKKGESFRFESGKALFFEARFKVSDATQSDVVIGLQITDTTPLDVTDGVFFIKADGAATVDFRVEKNNTATTASAIATMANDTFIRLGFYYDGSSAVQYFVNGTYTGSSVTTNLPDDEDMTVTIAIQNGEAAAKTMTVDYVYVAKER